MRYSRGAVTTVGSTMSGWAWTEEMHASFLNSMEDSFVLSLLGLTPPEHERCACASWPRFPDCSSARVSHIPNPGELGNAYHIRNRRRKRLATPSDEPQDQVVPQLLGNNGMETKCWEMQRKRISVIPQLGNNGMETKGWEMQRKRRST